MELYQLAVAQGEVYAQYNLGRMLRDGMRGLAKDVRQAISYFQLAAAQGHEEAQRQSEQLKGQL